MSIKQLIPEAAEIIKNAKYAIAFTGAGISVESGIPPFRGENGLWGKYDPNILDINYFYNNPEECWGYIRKIFYDFFSEAYPNRAHLVLSEMENRGLLKSVITQNIDNLHFQAGSKNVYEFHGNSKRLKCRRCGKLFSAQKFNLKNSIPCCDVDGEILKPDFIFFGEGIPQEAYNKSFYDAGKCDLCIIVGSTGEVTPASYIPQKAKDNGAIIIEINPEETLFTKPVTDIHLQGKASEILFELEQELF